MKLSQQLLLQMAMKFFWYPVRRDLAQALLASGDREGALREALATLKVRPRDPGAEAIIAQLTALPA